MEIIAYQYGYHGLLTGNKIVFTTRPGPARVCCRLAAAHRQQPRQAHQREEPGRARPSSGGDDRSRSPPSSSAPADSSTPSAGTTRTPPRTWPPTWRTDTTWRWSACPTIDNDIIPIQQSLGAYLPPSRRAGSRRTSSASTAPTRMLIIQRSWAATAAGSPRRPPGLPPWVPAAEGTSAGPSRRWDVAVFLPEMKMTWRARPSLRASWTVGTSPSSSPRVPVCRRSSPSRGQGRGGPA